MNTHHKEFPYFDTSNKKTNADIFHQIILDTVFSTYRHREIHERDSCERNTAFQILMSRRIVQ